MTIAAVRTAIAARLSSVADIGVVHAYERYSTDLAGLKQLYWSAAHNQVRGWFIRRFQTRESGNIQAHTIEQARWRIVGVMSLVDAAVTELAFDALLERIRDAFAADETLGGTVDQCTDPDSRQGEAYIQIDDAGPVMFGGVLCHGARLRLSTTRYLDRSTP